MFVHEHVPYILYFVHDYSVYTVLLEIIQCTLSYWIVYTQSSNLGFLGLIRKRIKNESLKILYKSNVKFLALKFGSLNVMVFIFKYSGWRLYQYREYIFFNRVLIENEVFSNKVVWYFKLQSNLKSNLIVIRNFCNLNLLQLESIVIKNLCLMNDEWNIVFFSSRK